MDILYSLASKEDLEEIFSMQNNYIKNPVSFATMQEDFNNKSYIYIVAKKNKKIIGYLEFSYVLEDADIISTAIQEEYRGNNIFANMLSFGENILKEKNVLNIFLEVRKSNFSAIKAYTKNNFVEISNRKNYYQNPVEDAIIMNKRL